MHVLLKTIIVLLFVPMRIGADEPLIDMQAEMSRAFSTQPLLIIPIAERPAFYLDLSEDENYSSELRELILYPPRCILTLQNILKIIN